MTLPDKIQSHIGWAYAQTFNRAALLEIAQTCRYAANHCRVSTYEHAASDAAFYDRATAILESLANPGRPD